MYWTRYLLDAFVGLGVNAVLCDQELRQISANRSENKSERQKSPLAPKCALFCWSYLKVSTNAVDTAAEFLIRKRGVVLNCVVSRSGRSAIPKSLRTDDSDDSEVLPLDFPALNEGAIEPLKRVVKAYAEAAEEKEFKDATSTFHLLEALLLKNRIQRISELEKHIEKLRVSSSALYNSHLQVVQKDLERLRGAEGGSFPLATDFRARNWFHAFCDGNDFRIESVLSEGDRYKYLNLGGGQKDKEESLKNFLEKLKRFDASDALGGVGDKTDAVAQGVKIIPLWQDFSKNLAEAVEKLEVGHSRDTGKSILAVLSKAESENLEKYRVEFKALFLESEMEWQKRATLHMEQYLLALRKDAGRMLKLEHQLFGSNDLTVDAPDFLAPERDLVSRVRRAFSFATTWVSNQFQEHFAKWLFGEAARLTAIPVLVLLTGMGVAPTISQMDRLLCVQFRLGCESPQLQSAKSNTTVVPVSTAPSEPPPAIAMAVTSKVDPEPVAAHQDHAELPSRAETRLTPVARTVQKQGAVVSVDYSPAADLNLAAWDSGAIRAWRTGEFDKPLLYLTLRSLFPGVPEETSRKFFITKSGFLAGGQVIFFSTSYGTTFLFDTAGGSVDGSTPVECKPKALDSAQSEALQNPAEKLKRLAAHSVASFREGSNIILRVGFESETLVSFRFAPEARTCEELDTYTTPRNPDTAATREAVRAVAVSPNGETVIGGHLGTIFGGRSVDADSSLNTIMHTKVTERQRFSGTENKPGAGGVRDLAFSPDGAGFFALINNEWNGSKWNQEIKRFARSAPTARFEFVPPAIQVDDGEVLNGMSISDDGKYLFGAGASGALYTWSTQNMGQRSLLRLGNIQNAHERTVADGTIRSCCNLTSLHSYRKDNKVYLLTGADDGRVVRWEMTER